MHFEMRMIPSGKWRRIDGEGSAEDRPHLVPVSDVGLRYITFYTLAGQSLCPGYVNGDQGEFLAFRFKATDDKSALNELQDLVNQECEKWYTAIKPQ